VKFKQHVNFDHPAAIKKVIDRTIDQENPAA
jgi:hypothetical protein